MADREPPADVQASTLAAGEMPSGRSAWRRWDARLALAAAVVIIAASAVIAIMLAQSGSVLAFGTALHGRPGSSASGRASAHHAPAGWSVQLTVHGLKDLGPGRFYECWYAAPARRPGHPRLIAAGTFTVGRGGSATVQMWTAANPHSFPTMQITAETAGGGGQHGPVILTGAARH